MTTTPIGEPLKVTNGDSWSWTRSGGDYPADAGWVLTYYLSTPGGTVKTIATTAQGGDFLVSLAPAATDVADFPPGIYNWFAKVVKGAEIHTLDKGRFRVIADPATTAATQTHAETCLAIIEAALVRCLGLGDVIEYEIDGVKFKKNKPELLTLRNAYRQEVRLERGQLGMRIMPVSLR